VNEYLFPFDIILMSVIDLLVYFMLGMYWISGSGWPDIGPFFNIWLRLWQISCKLPDIWTE